MRYHYRCTKTINGVRHYRRKALPRKIEEYVRPPKCPDCGTPFETEDKTKRDYIKKTTCTCDGIPFHHKKRARAVYEHLGLCFCNHRILTEDDQLDLQNQRG